MKRALYDFIAGSRLDGLARSILVDNRGTILAYHRVGTGLDAKGLLRKMIVDPDQFEQQMRYLKTYYEVIGLDEFIIRLMAKRSLRKIAAVTFDDAYADNFESAYPVLLKHGIPATIFVPTGYIETSKHFFWDELVQLLNKATKDACAISVQERHLNFDPNDPVAAEQAFHCICASLKEKTEYDRTAFIRGLEQLLDIKLDPRDLPRTLTWAQMLEMKRGRISFGAHTHDHQSGGAQTREKFYKDLFWSKKILDEKLHQNTTLFAFPFGQGSDSPVMFTETLRSTGFCCGLTMRQGFVSPENDPMNLKRLGIGGDDDMNTFKLKLAGIIPALHSIKKCLRLRS